MPAIAFDRQVHVTCYSTDHPQTHDAVTDYFKATADAFRCVHELEASAVARVIAQDQIDILVELAGHTSG